LNIAIRPYTSSKVVSSRLIGTPPVVAPVDCLIILPLNWLSIPNCTANVRRFRSVSCAGVPSRCTVTVSASVLVTSTRSPTLSAWRIAGSVVSSRRRE
jgi:hypothetical protein